MDDLADHLPLSNFIAVRDTCGVPSPVPGFPDSGISTMPHLPVRFSAPGGLYRLCWCGWASCDVDEAFRTDFGELQVLGPSPLEQHRTCISGQTCLLADLTFGGREDWAVGKLLILETCSVPSAVPRLPADGVLLQSFSQGRWLGQFESATISAAGGQYSMCWCATTPGPCLEATEFHVTLGRLDIVGPSPLLQDKTCISGQNCFIDGLLGTYTGSGDHVLIADTCGSETAIIAGTVNAGLADLATALVATWGKNPLTSAGGQYRLCWCSGAAECVQAGAFATDMGALLLVGPAPLDQHRTCISGLTCKFDGLTGRHMSSEDRVLLLDTCGAASSPFSAFWAATTKVTMGFGATVSWGDTPLKVSGGLYRLCWCSGELGEEPCSVAEGFRTDLGSLTMIGVSPHQDATCVSGLPCAIDRILGTFTSGSDKFLVLQTCGVSSAVGGFPGLGVVDGTSGQHSMVSWGDVAVTAAAGQYQLCWCPGAASCSRSDPGKLGGKPYDRGSGGEQVVGRIQSIKCVSR